MIKQEKLWMMFWVIVITIYALSDVIYSEMSKDIVIGFLWLWLILTIFGWFPRVEKTYNEPKMNKQDLIEENERLRNLIDKLVRTHSSYLLDIKKELKRLK